MGWKQLISFAKSIFVGITFQKIMKIYIFSYGGYSSFLCATIMSIEKEIIIKVFKNCILKEEFLSFNLMNHSIRD